MHKCELCGARVAPEDAGRIGKGWYCHTADDPDRTCYERASWEAEGSWEDELDALGTQKGGGY